MEAKQTLIFIVEDDPGFNSLITSFLSSKNVGVIKSFFSGEDCLEKISEQPDIILMDFDLPLKNGLETMREVKKRSPKTECIFLSGQSDVKSGIDTIKEGAVDYIVKDVNAKDNALNKIIELKKLKQAEKDKNDIKRDSSFYL